MIEVINTNITIQEILEDLAIKINFLELNIKAISSTLEALYGIDDNGSAFYKQNIPGLIYDLEDAQLRCQDKLDCLYTQHSDLLDRITPLNQLIKPALIVNRPSLDLIDVDDCPF